jgi:hypothetical protein
MPRRDLLTPIELKKEYPFLTDWMLFRLRKRKAIPYIKVGHRSFLYDPDRVHEALSKLEIKEVA